MKIMFKDKDYAVVEKSEEYILVYKPAFTGKLEWASGTYFTHTVDGLLACLELFKYKTDETYVSRSRAIELATMFKDKIIFDSDVEDSLDYFRDIDLEEYEDDFFGVSESISDKENEDDF